MTLPSASTITHLPITTQKTILDTLFEPSASLHHLILPLTRDNTSDRLQSYTDLIALVRSRLSHLLDPHRAESDRETLDAILVAHPRLGENKAASLSDSSRGEQAGLKGGGEAEEEELRKFNLEYEGMFPGLRFLTFVNARPRVDILKEGRERVKRGDRELERREGIEAMCDIAADRAKKMSAE